MGGFVVNGGGLHVWCRIGGRRGRPCGDPFHPFVNGRGRSCVVVVVRVWAAVFGRGRVGHVHSCGQSSSVGPRC